jgi:hypothetical protein
MIKCFFIDVKSISCDVPKSNFAESDLEQLANFILEADGLIRPLILKEIGVEKYLVIDGYREYYGALRAKEKDLKKAEMVNAFVISPKIERSAVAQLKLLSENAQPITNLEIPAETKDKGLEQLLPALASIISQQLQPLTQEIAKITAQLNEHKKILESLNHSSKIEPYIIEPTPLIIEPELTIEPILPIIKPEPRQLNIDRASITLNLINTLSPSDLSRRMQQSGIRSAIKLAESIITARKDLPSQKFDNWKIVVSKVSGLADKTAQTIIEKLR